MFDDFLWYVRDLESRVLGFLHWSPQIEVVDIHHDAFGSWGGYYAVDQDLE
jgi:hypothetical protein